MSLKQLAIFIRASLAVFFACLLPIVNASAHPKARLDLDTSGPLYQAFSLPRGSSVRISTSPQFSVVTKIVTNTIKDTYQELEEIFGPPNSLSVEVKLLQEDVFFLATQAPSWTNALYYDGTIIVPVKKHGTNIEDLKRSIRHEFTHAMLSWYTDGNAPGWFDEGFAQMMEGSAHPALSTALKNWIKSNPPVPFHMLQNGFTKLETKYVVPAYAQSFWAVRFLIGQYGLIKTRMYFEKLKRNFQDPFRSTFGISEGKFEDQVRCVLKNNLCLSAPESCTQCMNVESVEVRSAKNQTTDQKKIVQVMGRY
jgi:hypothetical protein